MFRRSLTPPSHVRLLIVIVLITAGAGFGDAPRTTQAQTGTPGPSTRSWRAGQSSPDGVWVGQEDRPMQRTASIAGVSGYRAVGLKPDALAAVLERARTARRAVGDTDAPTLYLPTAAGAFEAFEIAASPVMDPRLEAAHPDITTFTAKGLDSPASSGRLSITPLGLHALIVGDNGETQVIQRLAASESDYVVYSDRDQQTPGASRCLAPGDHASIQSGLAGMARSFSPQSFGIASLSSGATLRTYRVAIGATGEFTQRFGGGTVNGALAAITAGINAANAVLEKEASIRLVLIANETSIIYTNPATDGYTHLDLATMANENHDKLTTIIGEGNYDLGHVFDADAGLGSQGYAYFGVCVNGWKDVAGSIFYGVPPSDPIGLRTMLHELGHQFNAYHSFNGTTATCQWGRNSEGAYEPGSGSSIMSYADLCGAENVPSTSLYNAGALEQIINYTTTGMGDTCAVRTATNNTPPLVDAGPNHTIPASTPFLLTATGSDPDGDTVTYSWEQYDLGDASPPNTDEGTRPLFRIYNPATSPTRMFPELSYVLSNTTAVGQALPTTNRTMTMRVIARDNRSGGGGVSTDDTLLTVHAASGPFVVTAPNTAVTWLGGTSQTVTWNPAGTAGAPILTANVRILLSTDNGQTFPTVLAASTPNDGAESITAPNVATTNARVKVEAIGNVFFDISNATFTIALGGGQPNLRMNKVATVPSGGYVASGGTANIKDTTQNIGTGPSVLSHTKFYWSVNKTFDAGDTLLTPNTGREVPVLAPNASSQVTTTVGIPAAGVGLYYLFAVADANNTNAESNETDNAKAAKVYIGPDLVATKFTLSTTTIPAGGPVTVTLETTNKGAVAAGASVAKVYYSADKNLNPSIDSLLDTVNVAALNSGQKSTVSRTVNIPGGAVSGTRYILVRVDANNQVTEAIESNDKKVTITVP